MGKITKRGGVSRAEVRVFDAPRTAADELRRRGKLGPYRGARVEDFTAPAPAPLPEASEQEREHPGTGEPMEQAGEASADGAEQELTSGPAPAKPAKKATRRAPARKATRSKGG